VNLTELIRDRVDVWTATAEQNQISLELVASDSDVHASVAPGGIEQVLGYLLDNALRAAPDGSSVTVTESTDSQMVSIADSGGGLSDRDKEQALNRFWRSDDTTPGTGLGLAIVDTILKASGGSIELGNNTPSGLVATITLPAP
jgi:signal transduction histidine kinase